MDSVFRNDIVEQEASSFLMNTFIIPSYLTAFKYNFPQTDIKRIVNDVKSHEFRAPTGHLSVKDAYLTQSLMKRCFNKCREFVLEDWIDYDELDCTMKCTLVHKKSFEIMRETFKNL
jgi:hypothetical protein